MTIKTKNRLIFFLIFVSMALILTGLVTTGIFYFAGKITGPSSLPVLPLQGFFIFRYRFFCPIASVFVLLSYTFVTLLIINIEFEKTQSSEILFLAMFLVGCFAETARLAFPLLNLWDTNENAAIFASRLVLAGRIISTASILFSAAYSSAEFRQYNEQNLAIIFVLGLVFASFYPLNTSRMIPEGHFEWGYKNLLLSAQHVVIILSFILQLAIRKGEKQNLMIPIGLLLLSIGYTFLNSATNIFFLAAGTTIIIFGTSMYIRRLHNIYLWND